MTCVMHNKEFESVLDLPDACRYAYFIKRVADWEEVWSLAADDGWALAGDDQGRECIPVWPHLRFASTCATEFWSGNEPRSIELSTWLGRWIPGMMRERRLVAVFPTPPNRGVVVSPERLKEDLEAELSLIE